MTKATRIMVSSHILENKWIAFSQTTRFLQCDRSSKSTDTCSPALLIDGIL